MPARRRTATPAAAPAAGTIAARLPIDLALQGGGSHGAFTWGVLDRLLEERGLVIAGVSGTSAGAMNAVALAAGLMAGGRDGAREVLARLWQQVARIGAWHEVDAAPLPLGSGAASAWMQAWVDAWAQVWTHDAGEPARRLARGVQAWWADALGRTFSPYQLNPLNLNPLRDLLARTIDFERVRGCDKARLFISATHVKSGRLRIFRQHELSVDVVLASACLPLLFQAVEIDGEAYWDGGFAGNPSLLPLITESPADDLLLVQINPHLREAVPTSARDIVERMNEVTFNTSLLKELRSIALMKQLIAAEGRPGHHYREATFRRIEALRVHRIDGGAPLARLGASTKTDTSRAFLARLHGLGREAAERWLRRHSRALGRRSTVDLAREFLE
ncbi:MAG: patatin-like phospholipase family protein [Rubrivivax sp.]|nr:patatin-like phospholipase family protein [Rubrivivax sp.]